MKKENEIPESSVRIQEFLLRQLSGGVLSFSGSVSRDELDRAVSEGRYYYDNMSARGCVYNTFYTFYPMNIYPPCDTVDFSIWVLIYDCSDWLSYSLGYYDFELKEWQLLNFDPADGFHMGCWSFVPVPGKKMRTLEVKTRK